MTYSPQSTSGNSISGSLLSRHYPNWVQDSLTSGDSMKTSVEGNRTYNMTSASNTTRGFSEYNSSLILTNNFSVSIVVDCGKFDGTGGFCNSWGIYLKDVNNNKTVGLSIASLSASNAYAYYNSRSGTTAAWEGWFGANGPFLRGARIRDNGATRFFDLGFADCEDSTAAFIQVYSIAKTDHTPGPYYVGWSGGCYTNGNNGTLTLKKMTVSGFVS